MVFSKHDEKYLNKEGTDYLLDRLRELSKNNKVDLSNYYEKAEIDELISTNATENGITPHIGDNGNWYIGDTDTGVKAQGNDGEKGDKGDDGEQGIQGVQGIAGTDGTSPTIVENEDNTDSVYRLDITDINGTFTTPNLRGQNGTDATIDTSIYYNKTETNELLEGKSDTEHTHTLSDITDYSEPDLSGYAAKEHTHNLSDITDYTEPDLSTYATVDMIPDISNLAQSEHTHSVSDIEDFEVITEAEIREIFSR